MSERRPTPLPILMAEDDPDDRLFARKALERAGLPNPLFVVADGEELLDYLRRRQRFGDPGAFPRPALILLDLNMPRMDGRQALREIKGDPTLRRIPVVVLTTSQSEEDVGCSYDMGANSFITKPATLEAMAGLLTRLGEYWFQLVELPGGEGV